MIDMQPNVQQIGDTLIAARPDYLMLVNAQGQIRLASGACQDLLGLSEASLEQRMFDSLLVADAIIAMAKSLGLALIAEGVEYPAQISYLRQQACDTAQVFLFSEPCNAAQMQRLVDE